MKHVSSADLDIQYCHPMEKDTKKTSERKQTFDQEKKATRELKYHGFENRKQDLINNSVDPTGTYELPD